MALCIYICAITRCPNKSKLQPLAFTTHLKAQNINYKQHLPILSQNEPYTYLGIRLIPFLKWAIRKEITVAKTKNQNIALFLSPYLFEICELDQKLLPAPPDFQKIVALAFLKTTCSQIPY